MMKRATEAGANIIDVIAYPFITDLDKILEADPVATWGTYDNRLKIGGVKITIDGSPQGTTAFFTTPYLTGGPGGEKDWQGELTFPQETVNQMVKRVYDLGVPLNLHANGDAAIDTFLKAHEFAAAGDLTTDRDVTMIHAQFTRKDQIPKYVEVQDPAVLLHAAHLLLRRGAHRQPRRGAGACTSARCGTRSTLGLHPTNHTDFVVAPLDQMFMLWSAVNRISRGGAGDRARPARHAAGGAEGHDDLGRGAVRRAGDEGLARARQAGRPRDPRQRTR